MFISMLFTHGDDDDNIIGSYDCLNLENTITSSVVIL